MQKPFSIKDLSKFQSPTIFIPFLDTFIAYTGFWFIAGMLEPYMKDFAGATQGQVGTAFLLEGVGYTVTSLLAGLVIFLEMFFT